ncbi:MAG: hypothetical protein ACI97X_001545, partial [Oceanospirillaceae bacterium]
FPIYRIENTFNLVKTVRSSRENVQSNIDFSIGVTNHTAKVMKVSTAFSSYK